MARPQTVTAAIALGSNLGDRTAHLRAALEAIAHLPHTRLLCNSRLIETAPLPRPDAADPGGPYLNGAALVETTLQPRDLLDSLLDIERAAGRTRTRDAAERWAPRTLDLDLLTYGDRLIDEPGLTVPHPRLAERPFVLAPLAEIAPDLRVPPTGHTVAELLARLHQGSAP